MSEHLLNDKAKSGVYYMPPPRRAALEAEAKAQQLSLLPVDLGADNTAAKALRRLGKSLHFPSWYGANLDALYDCLTDPAWQADKGLVLLIDGMASLQTAAPQAFANLLEVLQAASEGRETGSVFWILLDTPAEGVAPLPDA